MQMEEIEGLRCERAPEPEEDHVRERTVTRHDGRAADRDHPECPERTRLLLSMLDDAAAKRP
jgi:hypothetical protein